MLESPKLPSALSATHKSHRLAGHVDTRKLVHCMALFIHITSPRRGPSCPRRHAGLRQNTLHVHREQIISPHVLYEIKKQHTPRTLFLKASVPTFKSATPEKISQRRETANELTT